MTLAVDQAPAVQSVSRRQALGRALRRPSIGAGALILLFFIAAALCAPLIAPADPLAQNVVASLRPPSPDHLLGTDKLGRDIFSRMLYGARISLVVGIAVVLIAGAIGTLLGLIAGYSGGLLDEALMRVTDLFFAFPALILAMAIAGALGPSLRNALIAISAVTWPVYARLIRGQVLALKEQEFVIAARALGVPEWRIVLRHLLPNTLAPLLVQASFDMGGAITSVAGLSFIGFGAQPPTPEWGGMLARGLRERGSGSWLLLAPIGAFTVAILAFNLLAEGLRRRR
jgi:peptide/nickel transport system permease protein